MAEEALIVAVSGYPELYNISSSEYHNLFLKKRAWREISLSLDISEEQCRSKWKYLRDKYLRERRQEQDKRSGAAGGTFRKRWKYMGALSFLEPHVKERTTSSNFSQANESQETAKSLLESIVQPTEIQQRPEEEEESLFSVQHAPVCQPSSSNNIHRSATGQRRTSAQPPGLSQFQEGVLEALRKDEDEDEHFLKSLLPSLRRLSPNSKFEARIKLLKALHDVETRQHSPSS